MKQETVFQRVDLLRARGMTISSIAEKSGVGVGTVAEIATRKTIDPKTSTVVAIMGLRVPRAKQKRDVDQ